MHINEIKRSPWHYIYNDPVICKKINTKITFTAAVSVTHASASVPSTDICLKHSPNRPCCGTTASTKRKMHATAECLHSFHVTKNNYKIHKFTTNLRI